MNNTNDTNSLENLVKNLQSRNDILEVFTGRGIYEVEAEFKVITSITDDEVNGDAITHKTAPMNDVIIIVVNGQLDGDSGVEVTHPQTAKGVA